MNNAPTLNLEEKYLDKIVGIAINDTHCLKQIAAELSADDIHNKQRPILDLFWPALQYIAEKDWPLSRGSIQAYAQAVELVPMVSAALLNFHTSCRSQAVNQNDLPGLIEMVKSRAAKRREREAKAATVRATAEKSGFKAGNDLAQKYLHNPKASPNVGKVKWCTFDEIEEKSIEWLWPNMIPLGGLTVIAGEGETGKSTFVTSLIARITTGAAWPDGSENTSKGKALYIASEEDVERILKPRLKRMGAITRDVHYIFGLNSDDGKTLLPWTLQELDSLREHLQEHPEIKVVVLDPLGIFFGSADSYKDTEVQAILQPLSKLGMEMGVTMIAIAHLGKGETRSIRHRILGSVAIPNTARCVMGVIRDKNCNDRSMIGIVKNNLGGKRSSLPFLTTGGELVFEAEISTDLESLAKTASGVGSAGRFSSDREVAKGIIQGRCAGVGADSQEVKEQCEGLGISEATVKRAAQELGVQSLREEKFGAKTVWKLPDDDRPF